MEHLAASELSGLLEGALSPEGAARVERHVDECPDCLRLLASAARGLTVSRSAAAGQEPAGEALPLARGAAVGRYLVLEPLGAGGMGLVYAGYDPELDRRVALKLLRPDDRTPPDELRARVQREAQALARLSHPNVTAVYEAGTVGGRVFIAMELVEGGTLRDWLRSAAREWREVLDVCLQAGRGLAAAHAAGVVHRDFKPDNVLVGKDGRARVTDFGLARFEGKPELPPAAAASPAPRSPVLTASGTLVGSPAYMAPEQLAGEAADARADVFSFCVAAWEALHGERPFAGHTPAEVREEIAQGRVRAPPAGSAVPGWVRRILLRGLDRDRAKRFSSMDELLRALSQDPRARRRRLLLGGAAVALLLVAGALLMQRRLQLCSGAAERQAAVFGPARAETLRQRFAGTGAPFAADAFAGVRAALDAWGAEWTAMRTQACEATRLRGEQSEALLDLRMACLDLRLGEEAALVEVLSKADGKTVERAVAAARALPSLAACRNGESLRATAPPAPAQAARVEQVRAGLSKARALGLSGQYAAGEALGKAAAADARALGYRPLQAEALAVLGSLQANGSDAPLASATLLQASFDAEATRQPALAAGALVELVTVTAGRAGKPELALPHAAHAAALLDAAPPDPALRARLLRAEGIALEGAGNYGEAKERYLRALAGGGFDAGDPFLGNLHNDLGQVLRELDDLPAAVREHQQALAIYRAALGPLHPRVGLALNNLGADDLAQAHYADALSHWKEALAVREKALGPEHMDVAITLGNLAFAYSGLEQLPEARAAAARGLAIKEKVLGPEHVSVAFALTALAEVEGKLGNGARQRELRARALAIREKGLGPDHPLTAESRLDLAAALVEQHDLPQAVDQLRRGLASAEKALGPEHQLTAQLLAALGLALLEQGEPLQAIPKLERAIAIKEKTPGEPLELSRTRFGLARAVAQSDPARARSLLQQARQVAAAAGPTGADQVAAIDRFAARGKQR